MKTFRKVTYVLGMILFFGCWYYLLIKEHNILDIVKTSMISGLYLMFISKESDILD